MRGLVCLLAVAASETDQWDTAAAKTYAALAATGFAPPGLPERVERRGDGVVYAAGGHMDFFEQEVLPCVRHLSRLREAAGAAADDSVRFALFAERHLLHALRERPADDGLVRRLFAHVVTYEDVELPHLRGSFASDVRVRVKSVKLHAMLFAPFERFVYLDFDSRPCRFDFARRLFAELETRGVDALLHDQWTSQSLMRGEQHYRVEHNSAIAVFNAATLASEAALRWFVWAFATMRLRRDQPAMMVGLRAAFLERGFTHADVGSATFCRHSASASMSCADDACLVVHKPQKYDPGALLVGVGCAGTGAAALKRGLAELKMVNRADAPSCASLADVRRYSPNCRALVAPEWSLASNYEQLAREYEGAKFVLTRSSEPCAEELAHNARVRAAIPPHRLFELDVKHAASNERDWRDLCAFVEAWSSCKTQALRKIAASWLRAHVPQPCR